MSFDAELTDLKAKFDKTVKALVHDFGHIRTGRASVAMVEHVRVDAYGAITPLPQVAGISVPEPAQILIKPWDRSLIKAIEKALAEAQLGMMPISDGMIIRLNVPPLSGERRKQLAGQAKEACEKCKVAMRTIRRDGIKGIEAKGKELKVSEDLVKKATAKVDEQLKACEAQAEKLLKEKSDDILTF
jgi:ribosome recycling factor